MGARGPKPGSGGRPRAATHKPNPRDGYKRETVGPPSAGTQEYVHRVVAGLKPHDPRTVDHLKPATKSNKPADLQVVSRAENTRRENVRNAGKKVGKKK